MCIFVLLSSNKLYILKFVLKQDNKDSLIYDQQVSVLSLVCFSFTRCQFCPTRSKTLPGCTGDGLSGDSLSKHRDAWGWVTSACHRGLFLAVSLVFGSFLSYFHCIYLIQGKSMKVGKWAIIGVLIISAKNTIKPIVLQHICCTVTLNNLLPLKLWKVPWPDMLK